MEFIDRINRELEAKFGKDVSLNNPRYRVVDATGITEYRYGTFADFNSEGTFLREVTERREVLKYPFNQGMYVLECLQGNDSNPELTTRVSYEPLWVFGAGGSSPTPELDKIEILIHTHIFCRTKNAKSPSDIKADELRQYLKEKSVFKQMLENEAPYIAGAIHAGEAVVVPSNFEKSE